MKKNQPTNQLVIDLVHKVLEKEYMKDKEMQRRYNTAKENIKWMEQSVIEVETKLQDLSDESQNLSNLVLLMNKLKQPVPIELIDKLIKIDVDVQNTERECLNRKIKLKKETEHIEGMKNRTHHILFAFWNILDEAGLKQSLPEWEEKYKGVII